jgi:hypothetical protein
MDVYVHVLSDILEKFCLLRLVLLLLWKHITACRCLREVFFMSLIFTCWLHLVTYNEIVLFGRRDEVSVLARVILYKWDFICCIFSFGLQAIPESNILREQETRQLRVLFARLDFQKVNRKCHHVTFLHISWGMLLNLIYGQGAIRYKMHCMHFVAYLLYYGVVSNCIIACVAYLLYYRLGHCCCFFMQIFFCFL